MQMTIYDAVTVGSKSNCVYPNPVDRKSVV